MGPSESPPGAVFNLGNGSGKTHVALQFYELALALETELARLDPNVWTETASWTIQDLSLRTREDLRIGPRVDVAKRPDADDEGFHVDEDDYWAGPP